MEISKQPENQIVVKAQNPLSSLKYDSVVAYDYDSRDQQLIVDDSGQLAKTVSKRINLPANSINEIITILGDDSTFGGDLAHCFDPHIGIVFYKENKVIEHLSICLDCNSLNSLIPLPNSSGFSKTGRLKINRLCKEWAFSHCMDSLDTEFDR